MPRHDNAGDKLRDKATAIMALAMTVILWATVATAGQESGYTPQPDMAYAVAQRYAKNAAVSPSTIDWPWADYDKTVKYVGERKYIVRQYFDSQNGFGAMVRTKFTAIIQHGEDDTWRVIAFDDKWY